VVHSLGKKPERDPRDVVARLVDCHARIREMIRLAGRLASEAGASDEERAETAARVSRYFRRALPFHVRDEEDSIAPRIASVAGAALDRMRAEHTEHEADVAALVGACDALGEDPGRWAELAPEVLARATSLERAFAIHLEEEERDVFPHIAALDEATRAAIVTEMEARRDSDGGGGRRRRQ
jgi:iron-sulfur cluster repair protein YtfE (RIC family)